MIKILHFGLSSSLGGIETYLMKLTEHINRDAFQFDFLIIGDEKPCFYQELKDFGCNFYFITPRKDNYFENKKQLMELFQTQSFDIVHCHLNSLSYIEPVLAAVKSDLKVIVHSRNGQLYTKSKMTKLLNWVHFYSLPKKKLKLLAVSDKAGEWMFGKDAAYTVINNGVDTQKFEFSAEKRKRLRDAFHVNESTTVIVHTGAFRPQKNHEFILDIFHEYLHLNPDAKLMLIGDGELRAAMEAKAHQLNISDNVLFLGVRSDIPDILSAGDFFLFPSRYEGFPNALIEAQSAGLRCFTSDAITKQVAIDGLCISNSLNQPPADWANALFHTKPFQDRKKAVSLVKEKKLSVEDEIGKLTQIYLSYTNGVQ